jgi:hypothetical protein
VPPILFNFYYVFLMKETVEGFGYLKIEGQIIRTVKYADDLVLDRSSIQQEGDPFHQKIGGKIGEEDGKVMHFEHNVMWC